MSDNKDELQYSRYTVFVQRIGGSEAHKQVGIWAPDTKDLESMCRFQVMAEWGMPPEAADQIRVHDAVKMDPVIRPKDYVVVHGPSAVCPKTRAVMPYRTVELTARHSGDSTFGEHYKTIIEAVEAATKRHEQAKTKSEADPQDTKSEDKGGLPYNRYTVLVQVTKKGVDNHKLCGVWSQDTEQLESLCRSRYLSELGENSSTAGSTVLGAVKMDPVLHKDDYVVVRVPAMEASGFRRTLFTYSDVRALGDKLTRDSSTLSLCDAELLMSLATIADACKTKAVEPDPLVELLATDDAAMKVWATETRARNRAETPPGLRLKDHLWHKAWLAWSAVRNQQHDEAPNHDHEHGPKLQVMASCYGEPHPWRVLEYHYDRLDYMGVVSTRLTIRYTPHQLADAAYTWRYEELSMSKVLGSGVGSGLVGAHQAALAWLQQPDKYNAGIGFREALTEVIEQHEAALEARKIPQPERLGVAYVQQRVKAEVNDAGGAELGGAKLDWTTRPITRCPSGTDAVHLGYVFDLSLSISVRAFNDAQLTDIIEALNALAAQATNAPVVEPTS